MEVPSKKLCATDCYVCGKTYENPKQLPCFHVFCQKCLLNNGTTMNKNAGDALPCPLCRKEFTIPPEGFDGLQTDIFLSRLTEKISEDRTCEVCPECANNTGAGTEVPFAVEFSTECQQKLSGECCNHHCCDEHTSATTTCHEIELLEVRSCSSTQDLHGVLEVRNCDIHAQEKLNFYCSDCDKTSCGLCFDEKHQNHRLQGVRNAAAMFCYELQSSLYCLSDIKLKMLQNMKDFDEEKLKLREIANCLRDNVDKRRNEIVELADKHAQSLLKDIDSEELRLLSKIETISEERTGHLTCLEFFKVYCTEVTRRASSDDVCSIMTSLRRTSDEMKETYTSINKPKIPRCSSDFKESDLEEFFRNDGINIVGTIPNFGRQISTRETKKEQLLRLEERLNERINELRSELRETKKENRKWKTEVEKLKQELEFQQSLIKEKEELNSYIDDEAEKRHRVEIDDLQQQLEQIKSDKELMERQHVGETMRHQESNEHLTKRIQELGAEQQQNHIEIGRLSDEVSVLTKLIRGSNSRERPRYQINKEYSRQIMKIESAETDVRVTGLAVLEGELFITTSDSDVLEIRDLTKAQILKRRVKIVDLKDPYDMCSCPQNHCLYIYDKALKKICRVEKHGIIITAWSTGDNDGTLSVAYDSSVLLTLHQDNNLREYNMNGTLSKEIKLYEFGIDWPWHAVKLNRHLYVIGHGDYRHRLQRVCIVDIEVTCKATIMSFGEDLGRQMKRDMTPYYLVRDAAGSILVADRKNNQVLQLTPTLEFDKEINAHVDYCNRPEVQLFAERFCLDEACKYIIVASNYKKNARWTGSVALLELLA